MNTEYKKSYFTENGFSLAECIVVLVVAAMILVSVLSLYGYAEKATASIDKRLAESRLGSEILQRIAEDIDTIATSGLRTRITIENKYDEGYAAARLEMTQSIYDDKKKPQIFKKIIWQSSYDYESPQDGLVLYRSYSGIDMEDKLLHKNKEAWQREAFVPLCQGITFFRIEVVGKDELHDRWTSVSPPRGILVSVSLAEPFEGLNKMWQVYEKDITSRNIAIDRTRTISFKFVEIMMGEDYDPDANSIDGNDIDPNDINGTDDDKIITGESTEKSS